MVCRNPLLPNQFAQLEESYLLASLVFIIRPTYGLILSVLVNKDATPFHHLQAKLARTADDEMT